MDETAALDNAKAVLAQETASDRLKRARLTAIIEKMMAGTIEIGRPLSTSEVARFDSQHVAIVLDILGSPSTYKEIAARHGVSEGRVRSLGIHPYTKLLAVELAAVRAEQTIDPMLRIKAVAHEMIDTKLEIIRDQSTPKVLRNMVATDLLDRAGLSAPKRSEQKVEHSFTLPVALAERLARGLEESKEIPANASYDRFLMSPSKLLQGETPSASEDLTSRSGQPKESVGASPDAPAVTARVA